jgi:hypothetical protein
MKLLTVADVNCWFTLIGVGALESQNDSSVLSNSSLEKAFSSGDLNVPLVRNIQGTNISITLYFVRDKAFPLKPQKYHDTINLK